MNKKEVLKIIGDIEAFYNNPWTRNKKMQYLENDRLAERDATKEEIILKVVTMWHKILKDYEFERVYENLMKYVKTNKFAPVISDLIEQPKEYTSRAIPNVEETAAYLREMENQVDDAPEGTKAEAQRKIREILGLDNDRQ